MLALAILIDGSPCWWPEHYQSVVWEQPVIQFSFYIHKLLDYRNQEHILENQGNPFACFIAARRESCDRVIALLTFIDWVAYT
ncbi:hypothetical protein [Rickettsiella grylli]|uniref:hypothetical protein n=1 Tax=Rickettsiella grylli TaxID=59196 RepID=UPI0000DAE7A9|nr:hypothetical protein [Rickettsiella grylli]